MEVVEKARMGSAGGEPALNFDMRDIPPVIGEKNATKFTPHLASIRVGSFQTASDLQSLWTYVSGLQPHEQFNFILDDRTFEDSCYYDEKIMHAKGLGAQCFLLKGNLMRSMRKIRDTPI